MRRLQTDEVQLQIFGADPPLSVATASTGGAAFVWSPDGRQVAYAVRRSANDRFYGAIHLFDQASGQSSQLTDVGLQILAFFWDPAGQRIGYLTQLAMA